MNNPNGMPISALKLPERTRRLLERAGIKRVRDLTMMSEADILRLRYMGKYGLTQIKRALARFGLRLEP